ncbi:MAG TPA: acyl-CoA thioesterase II [Caulobacteraceae bacterium]|jgi:acyl-CoA thioesterase-2|nr:acyl-CoA thioesterase II [Caulobacteraceae bacterium]
MAAAANLIDTLALERIEVNLFRGVAPNDQGPRIFGGLVIGQALLAAYRTVEERICHSLHCYFIRPGDPAVPILYDVDRSRDGKSFTTRRVTAIQHGAQIFNLAASFQIDIPGFEHQEPMPDVPAPQNIGDQTGENGWRRDIEMRWVDGERWSEEPVVAPPRQNVWMRAVSPLPDEIAMQQAALAYASDMSLLSTAMRPHAMNWRTPGFQSASLDHAIWFHRPSNFNHWHLYAQRSPSASGSRGFNLGEIFTAGGELVASTAQEGLMRLHSAEGPR